MVEAAIAADGPAGTSPDEIKSLIESSVDAATSSSVTQADIEQIVENALAERLAQVERSAGSLTIYSGKGKNLVDPIIQQFSAARGIKVKVKCANTTELAATLQEEGDRSPADVLFAQDSGGLGET